MALDALGERLRGGLAALAQRRRDAIGRRLGGHDGGRGPRDALVRALALGQLERGGLGARAQLGRLVDAAEAPPQLRELLQPLLDAVEHGGVGIQACEVRAQLDGRLAQLLRDARQLVARAGERGVVLAHAGQRVRRLAGERHRARALVGVEQLGGRARGLEQRVEMAQPAALAREVVLLAGLRIDLLEGVRERAQLRQAALLVGGGGLGVGERAPCGGKRAPGGLHVAAQRGDLVAAGGVDQIELHGRAHEPPRLVLGDHLDQRLADALEVVARAAAPVEQRPRASLAPHAARDRDALGALRRELGQLLGQLGLAERRLDVGLVAGRADERGVRAAAEQQPDGLGEDRLAGTGLTGQHVQARVQREARGAHEHEVLDDELLEHQRVKASR